MTSPSHLLYLLENKSMSLLGDAMNDVREHGGPAVRALPDDELQVALYTVLVKVIDLLRSSDPDQSTRKPDDTRSIFLSAVRDMMEHIDGQSAYTSGHTRAVVRHVVKLAALSKLGDDEIDQLETSAWVHNIGLINQSHKLASLPRTLTEAEMRSARNHAVVGAEMLRPISFLAHLVPIVRFHHARFDGAQSSIEPRGEDIPLGARMICLADAYQAMLEPRAYRAALSRQEAVLEIERAAGTQFDPQLVPFVHELT